MEIAKENSTTTLMEVDIGNSTDSLQRYLELQKELFHSQIDQLQKIVVTQCKLTGANPLSQEMAAGALSINIGKRPRDLLNPKAVKYMQSVFSIKDTISKKESREISALFGVTITQVREFFASQRSRVRKHVRLAREKAIKSDKCKTSQDECSTSSDPATSIIDQAPLNTLEPKAVEEAPSSSSQGETIPGIDASDKNFLDNIFNLMRKEEMFSGQVKLMEWIMRIQNPSVLYWFLTKGGLMILAAWLSNAAIEEQTTILLVILKVLCHLPLHKALPVQMSAILQTVNRLRFYRTSDISNRAKVLLSRWSKLFVRSQALKKPSFTDSPNEIHKEIIQKQRTSEMINSELQSKVDLPEDILAFTYESSENCRKSESPQALKLLPASADDSNKKHSRSVTSTQTRERRKVLLVEQPGRNSTGRSLQVARPVSSNQGRPMSTDDIQKAKMRAVFMQSKYGKSGASSNENHQQKTEVPNRPSASQTSHLLLASRTPVRPKIEEKAKPVVLASETSTLPEAPVRSKLSSGSQDPSWEKLKRDQIPWQMPPDIRINSLWRVGAGEKSKEVEIQRDRMRREKEIVYQRIQDIPPNPKEPWDCEMDYDDTLTPEIPTEQPPDADGAENLPSPHNKETVAEASTSTPVPVSIGNVPETEPDLELLAVLLKNPELVFALTSGHGGNITSEETVKLLDMIKTNGIGLPTGNSNRLAGGNIGGNVEVMTLPSPTPPSEIRMNRWRSEVAKDQIPQRFAVAATPTIPMQEKLPTTGLNRPQTPTMNFSMLQSPSNQQQQRHPVINSEYFPTGSNPSSSLPMTQIRTNPSSNQISSLQQNMLAAGLPLLQPEAVNFGQMHNVKPASVSIVLNHPHKDRIAVTLPSLLPTPLGSQPPMLPEPSMIQPQPQISWQWNENSSNSGSGRQTGFEGSVSNPPPPPQLQVDQNNYNVFAGGGSRRLPFPQYPSWERNEYVSEQELENWSPDRSPDRSPGYRSGRNISEPRRDTGGRNSRNDWSRRRDSGRRDSSRNGGGGNRRWRDRRN